MQIYILLFGWFVLSPLHCYENAIAERVNGILKDEYLLDRKFKDFTHAEMSCREAIMLYNTRRPHLALNYKTPKYVHHECNTIKEQKISFINEIVSSKTVNFFRTGHKRSWIHFSLIKHFFINFRLFLQRQGIGS